MSRPKGGVSRLSHPRPGGLAERSQSPAGVLFSLARTPISPSPKEPRLAFDFAQARRSAPLLPSPHPRPLPACGEESKGRGRGEGGGVARPGRGLGRSAARSSPQGSASHSPTVFSDRYLVRSESDQTLLSDSFVKLQKDGQERHCSSDEAPNNESPFSARRCSFSLLCHQSSRKI